MSIESSSSELRSAAPEEAGFDGGRWERVERLVSGWLEEQDDAALDVLVARRGRIVLEETSGGGSFPLHSASEALTAACTLSLVEDGLLGLARPIADYLPEITGDGTDDVLIAHLLSHVSGFTDPDVDRHSREHHNQTDNDQVGTEAYLSARWDAPLSYPPAREMRRCNYGYELVGEIARRITNQSTDDFALEHLFEPLAMENTRYEGDSASSGVRSTARDLASFLQMLLANGRRGDTYVLSRPGVEAMTRNQIPGIGSYGYGFWRESETGPGPATGPLPSAGSLQSPSTVHQRSTGVFFWADRDNHVLGVVLGDGAKAKADLLQNLITAAIV